MFMSHYGIRQSIQQRVLQVTKIPRFSVICKSFECNILRQTRSNIFQHYYLQVRLWRGVALPKDTYFYMFDTPDYLQDDGL